MKLTPAQSEIAKDTHRFRVVNCGRRFGKTILTGEEILGAAVSQDDIVIPYIAPTFRQARDIAWRLFLKRFRPITVSVNESRLEITLRTRNGGQSLIMLRGWETIESMRGMAFPFLCADEVAMYRDFWEGWQEVLRPALTDYSGAALFTSTPKGFNHFYDLYNIENTKQGGGEWKSFHFTTYDNPYIPVEEINAARSSMTEDRFAQEYLADFRKQEGLVYKEFDRDKHLFDDFTPRGQQAESLVAIDYGFTNPAAVLYIVKDYDNTLWVQSEWYKRGKTDDEVNEYAVSLKANVYYADPENASGIEKLKRTGANVRDVNKDVIGGIDAVRNALKSGKLRIHKDCVNLISELETYHYPDKKPNNNEPEKPVKENDHALDALRYAVFMSQPIIHMMQQPEFNLYGTRYN